MANLFLEIALKLLTVPAVATATVTSSVADVSGYTGSNFYVTYGDSGDTLASDLCWTAKLKECATEGGTFTDVSDDDIGGPDSNSFGLVNAPTEDQATYAIRYTGSKDFVKVEVTATGTHTNGTIITVHVALGLPRSQTSDADYNP